MSMLPDLVTGTSPAEAWHGIDNLRLMRRFEESLDYEDATAFVAMQDDLSPDERLLLRFLMATYDHSLHTIDGYCRHIASFLNYTQKSALHVTARDVEAFVRHCRAKGLKPRSINTIIGALKSFFNRLAATGAIPLNPTAFLKRRRTDAAASMPGHLSHSLSESEMAALFDRLAEHQAPERDILLLKTLFMTGLRGEEAVSLRWKNVIEWQGHRYFDVVGKGSKARRVYLPREIDEGLRHYGERTGTDPNRPIFGNLRKPDQPIQRYALYQMVKKWLTILMGRPEVSPHWFRHSCFTALACKGVRLESIKALAGHASIETTMLYNEAAQLMAPAGAAFDEAKRDPSR